jgi:hypothetical protein
VVQVVVASGLYAPSLLALAIQQTPYSPARPTRVVVVVVLVGGLAVTVVLALLSFLEFWGEALTLSV